MPRGHYLTEAVKEAIWELRAEGGSEAEIGRRLGLPKRTVSKYLERVGGIRPRSRRRSERCLTLAEREEISRGDSSWRIGSRYRSYPRPFSHHGVSRDQPLRRPWALSRPRGRAGGVASGATPASDEARALFRAA